MRRLREQAEARARETRDQLDRDEETGGPDRDERGAPLWAHGGRLGQPTAAYSAQRSGTPLSSCSPRSSKRIPEPATRSRTVRVTSTSPGLASAPTRAPMWTVIPAME